MDSLRCRMVAAEIYLLIDILMTIFASMKTSVNPVIYEESKREETK